MLSRLGVLGLSIVKARRIKYHPLSQEARERLTEEVVESVERLNA